MKKILIQLWEQCNHKCSFCFQNGLFSDKDKISNVKKAIGILTSPSIVEVETINLMGGELFDFIWDDELSKAVNDLFIKLKELLKGNLKQIYIMTNFMYDSSNQLDKFLKENLDIKDKISFCTSWDYKGRFKNKQDEIIFFQNIEKYHNLGYNIFCSVTLSEALMKAVLEENFKGLYFLKDIFGNNLNYHTPHGELFSEDKLNLKDFYPSRNLFFRFILKMKKEGLLSERFLNEDFFPDTYFYLKNDEYVLHNGNTLSIGSYSDNQKTMFNDYNMLKEEELYV